MCMKRRQASAKGDLGILLKTAKQCFAKSPSLSGYQSAGKERMSGTGSSPCRVFSESCIILIEHLKAIYPVARSRFMFIHPEFQREAVSLRTVGLQSASACRIMSAGSECLIFCGLSRLNCPTAAAAATTTTTTTTTTNYYYYHHYYHY